MRMEAEEGAEVRPRGARGPEPSPGQAAAAAAAAAAGDARCGASLSGTSYWLDLWLFVLFDAALFVFFYLLP